MAIFKPTNFKRLTLKQQASFCRKIVNYDSLVVLLRDLTVLNPILTIGNGNRFTLHSDKDKFLFN